MTGIVAYVSFQYTTAAESNHVRPQTPSHGRHGAPVSEGLSPLGQDRDALQGESRTFAVVLSSCSANCLKDGSCECLVDRGVDEYIADVAVAVWAEAAGQILLTELIKGRVDGSIPMVIALFVSGSERWGGGVTCQV